MNLFETFFQTFDDVFLFWLATVCALLTLADWSIGRDGRAAMREKIAEWWVYLEDTSFAGFVAKDAEKIHGFFVRWFGHKWLSWRRLWPAIWISPAVLIIITSICSIYLSNIEMILVGFVIYLAVFFPNIIGDYISLNVTISFLRSMKNSTSSIFLIFIMILDFLLVVVISFIVFVFGVSTWSYEDSTDAFEIVGGMALDYAFAASILVIVITTILPSLGHIFVTIGFLLSKLFKPIIKTPLSWLLYRFYESEKGVLTQIAIGGGVLVKLGQQAIKIYG